jgi:chloramphenicol-sensitive protein RarD
MSDTTARHGLTTAHWGVIFCVIAHLFWGAMAPYFGFIRHIPALEIAVNRGLWSLPIALIVVLAMRQWDDIRTVLREPRNLLILTFTSSIILFNWGFYVWSIEVGRAIESSLGYFINPLLNVLAGYLFLGERFKPAQLVAIALATVAVIIMSIASGAVPWLGLMLGASFCLYGLVRKQVKVGPTQGFLIEVAVLFLPLLAVQIYLMNSGKAHFGTNWFDSLMLIGCGPLTAGALIFFAAAIKRIRYSTAGILQYISPTLVFLTAVFIFKEPMSGMKWAAFVMLWTALAIYSWSSLQDQKKAS